MNADELPDWKSFVELLCWSHKKQQETPSGHSTASTRL